MTLIQTAGVGGNFTIVTADTRMVKSTYRKSEGKLRMVPGTTRAMEEKVEKAGFLTDYVVFGAGGKVDVYYHIRDELHNRVKPSDDLENCKAILEDIIEEIESEEAGDLKDFFHSKGGISIQLSGFYKNGDSGLVNYNSMQPIEELRSSAQESQILVAQGSPNTDLGKGGMNLLTKYIPGQPETVDGYLQGLFIMQSVISLLYEEEVSSDINFYIIFNVMGTLYKKEGKWDTAAIYPHIEEMKSEVEKDLGIAT